MGVYDKVITDLDLHKGPNLAMQQNVVDHEEHDKAQKKSWSSTASGLSSRCPDTVS